MTEGKSADYEWPTFPKSLARMAHEVEQVNRANGWQEEPRPSFGDEMALLHSEVSEALEAFRVWGLADATGCPSGDTDCTVDCGRCKGNPKPEGVGSEFADVLIRLLDNCHKYGIDLAAEYERKLAYNRTRGYRHGGKRL